MIVSIADEFNLHNPILYSSANIAASLSLGQTKDCAGALNSNLFRVLNDEDPLNSYPLGNGYLNIFPGRERPVADFTLPDKPTFSDTEISSSFFQQL